MKNKNMKWISFVTVLVIMFALLVPITFAETEIASPENMVPENAIGEIADATEAESEDAVAKDDATEYDAPKMIFEPTNFVKNLEYMAKGMLGIFGVIGVIVLATACLNKLFKDRKED